MTDRDDTRGGKPRDLRPAGAPFEWNGAAWRPHGDLSWREVHGELVAVNVSTGEYHVFNGVGSWIWEAIDRGVTAPGVVEGLSDRYGVERERITSDLEVFLQALFERGLLQRVSRPAGTP